MENTNTKWFAGAIAMVMILLFLAFASSLKTTAGTSMLEEILTVSMPRPIKEFLLGFSLEGRNILREVEGSVAGKQAAPKAPPAPTKAAVDKGAKSKAAQAKAQAAAKARAQINEQRRKAFQARVIEQAERYRRSLQDARVVENTAQYEEAAPWTPRKHTPTGGSSSDLETENRPAKTAAEWESLILSQPTNENVQSMISALGTQDIDLDTYLKITEALIKDNSQEKRNNGMKALSANHSSSAFTLAANLVDDVDANTQKALNDYMYGYNPQYLSVFEQVLQSNDTVAATAASQMITLAIQNIPKDTNTAAQASTSTSSSSRRQISGSNGTVGQLSLASYRRLIPTLRIIQSRNLNNLSQWAQNLLSQLQATTTTA